MNYIVSGLERSGTAMMMQMLEAGGIPVAYNGSRPADYHNPRGYYELEGGKVIRSLMNGTFPLSKYDGKFIKITAYGLKFLPIGEYIVIYMERDIDEVLDSTQRMDKELDRDNAKPLMEKLNRFCLQLMASRDDMKYLVVNYNIMVNSPWPEIMRVHKFLGLRLNIRDMFNTIDHELYRNRRMAKGI